MLENVLTYYLLIFHVILPFIRGGKWRKFLLLLTALYSIKVVYGFYEFQQSRNFYTPTHMKESKTLIPENSFQWFFLWFVIFGMVEVAINFAACLIIEWLHKKRQQIILEKQKAQAELSALKHQINPHFLFNSLSFIYSKSIRLDEDVAHAVLLLADIMRYALTIEEDKGGKVLLEKEITHLKNVMEMNQRRLNNRLHIVYEEYITNKQLKILPLVLITLVENAFKHGDLLDSNYPLQIQLNTQSDHLLFTIKNKKGNGIKELSNGIGLSNIKQRLNLTYGEKHLLVTKEDAFEFSVFLKIPIEE